MIPAEWSNGLAPDSQHGHARFLALPSKSDKVQRQSFKALLFADLGPEHKDFWVPVKPVSAFCLTASKHKVDRGAKSGGSNSIC